MRDFAPYLSRVYPGGRGGGASSGGGGGGGMRGLGGGGGGGGDSGISQLPTDPLELYRGKQLIDEEMDQRARNQAMAAVRANTIPADQPQNQQQVDNQFPEYDEAGTQVVPGTPEQNAAGAAQQAAPQQGAPGQQAEFTQSDGLQLQRLQASRARVQGDLSNGMIDQGTAQRMIAQLQIPTRALQQMQMAAQVQQRQQLVQQQQDEHAHQTAMELTTNRMRATADADGIRMFDGVPHQWDPIKQQWAIMPGWEARQTHLATQRTTQQARDTTEDTNFLHHLAEVRKLVYGSGTTRGIELKDGETQEQAIDRIMIGDRGHANLESLQTARSALRNQQPMTGRPEAQWTPLQRQENSTLNDLQRRIEQFRQQRPDSTSAIAMNSDLQRARAMLYQAGTIYRMPERGKEYLRIRREIDKWLETPWAGEGQQGPVRSAQPGQEAQTADTSWMEHGGF